MGKGTNEGLQPSRIGQGEGRTLHALVQAGLKVGLRINGKRKKETKEGDTSLDGKLLEGRLGDRSLLIERQSAKNHRTNREKE